nr:putative reverse transcriptase domain-containing protein [Tanacetum cinerariifolium]
MIDQGVTATLAARDALRSTNGDDSHNSGTGVRRTERAARECTYTDFLKCQPLPLKGTEGVASLSQWCERMESVFHISKCTAENQVEKYVGGLPDLIHGSVVASKPKTMQESIEIATELMDKKVKFEWGDKQEAAFQLLKQKLCSASILALPEGSKDFIVYCDASNKGLGAVLMPREKVISYASPQLKIHEKKTTRLMTWNLEQ